MNKPTRIISSIIAAIVLVAAGVAGGYAWANSRSSTNPATINAVATQASSTGHNGADVMFAQMMVPHHAQALDMAKLAATRASSAQVKSLAATIEAVQQPEIDTMSNWLKAWNATGSGSMSMSHGMTGMMSDSDMTSPAKLHGSQFDQQFLTMMIQHHTGAIAMANDELKTGNNADALALASSIYVTQQAQITQMKQMLKQ